MAPPLGFTFRAVIGQAECSRHGQGLSGESFVQLNPVDVGNRQLHSSQELLDRGYRADAHQVGVYASGGGAYHTGEVRSGQSA